MPTENAGNTTIVRSTLYPNDMIHAVSVVPILAPMMTDIACASVSNPAFTNDTVITVVADDDCTAHVINVPVTIPVSRFFVIFCRMRRNCEPAIFCKLSLNDFMPNISNANEPTILNTYKRVLSIFKYHKTATGVS